MFYFQLSTISLLARRAGSTLHPLLSPLLLKAVYPKGSDSHSLHKYLYVHNNPVNGIDPTGMFNIIAVTVAMFTSMKLRTIKLAQTYRQYSRARKIMTAIGVALVISQAAISYVTGGASVELAFSKCPIIRDRKNWPDIKFEFSYRNNVSDMFKQMSKLKVGITKHKKGELDGGGSVGIGLSGSFVYDFINKKADMSGAFDSRFQIPLYKKGPLELWSKLSVKFLGANTGNEDFLEGGFTWDLGLDLGLIRTPSKKDPSQKDNVFGLGTSWTLFEIMPPRGKFLGLPLVSQ